MKCSLYSSLWPYKVQAIFSNLNWTCLLIPLKYMENQEQSGQVQLRLEKIACTRNKTRCNP